MSTELHQSCGRLRPAREPAGNSCAGRGRGWDCGAGGPALPPATAADDDRPRATRSRRVAPHFAPKANSVIWLFMEGGPSAVDLFDPKPELDKNHGKRLAIDVFNGNPGPLMRSPFAFRQYGESGAWVCEKYRNVAQHVDDIAFIKSCYTESNDHVPALYQMNTGVSRVGLPTAAPGSPTAWGARTGTCPGSSCSATRRYQGRAGELECGVPAHHLPGDVVPLAGQPHPQPRAAEDVADEDQRRSSTSWPGSMASTCAHPGEPDLSRGSRASNWPTACRWRRRTSWISRRKRPRPQTLRPRGSAVTVVRPEVPAGPPAGGAGSAIRAGLQRRRVGRPQRPGRQPLRPLRGNRRADPRLADRPQAPGLFDSTLVIWGGEFGRMPVSQGSNGRDHNPQDSSSGWPAPASRGA